MKLAFREQRITPKRAEQIERANAILEEYAKQGYRLTLRQLYYQLVARDLVPNEVREYSKLSETCVIGRMCGLIDWDAMEDRLRKPYLTYAVDSIEEAIEDTISQYKRNRQEGQSYNIEIWTEKDAVSNILKRVSIHYHVRLMVNRGYTSCSAMYEAYNRVEDAEADKGSVILYVGDHDPSGLDMLRDIEDRLREFGAGGQFKVVPVALTAAQINKYKPPPNPAKISDPRAGWYIREFGDMSWELDALPPEVLEKIVKKAVLVHLDSDVFDGMLVQEQADKDKLRSLLKSL